MSELNWISHEVQNIHDWFQGIFYLLVTVFLLLGVFIEYFKLPLGDTPSFAPMLGRVLIAAILLNTYPEVHNLIADLSDALSLKMGDTSGLQHALSHMGDKLSQLSWSWVSIRQNIVVVISYLCFLLLYFSVHVAESLYLYTLVVLYVFSPILIALFVLPQTAGATKALYRSLIEAAMWKPVWCCIATILWSSGISDIQAQASGVSFISSICFCIIAAGSLVLTPQVIHGLASGGMAAMAGSLSNLGIDGVASLTPLKAASMGKAIAGKAVNTGLSVADHATSKLPQANRIVNSIPRVNMPKKPPLFVKQAPREYPRQMNLGEQAQWKTYGVKPPDIANSEKGKGRT